MCAVVRGGRNPPSLPRRMSGMSGINDKLKLTFQTLVSSQGRGVQAQNGNGIAYFSLSIIYFLKSKSD